MYSNSNGYVEEVEREKLSVKSCYSDEVFHFTVADADADIEKLILFVIPQWVCYSKIEQNFELLVKKGRRHFGRRFCSSVNNRLMLNY